MKRRKEKKESMSVYAISTDKQRVQKMCLDKNIDVSVYFWKLMEKELKKNKY